MADRAPTFEVVPKGTESTVCKGHKKPGGTCRAVLYFIERPRKGKPGMARIPIHCDVAGGVTPDAMTDGRGVNHFTDCPDVGNF